MNNPWNDLKKQLHVGQVIDGTVKQRMPFGVFVDIGAGFPALVEIVDIQDAGPVTSESMPSEGQSVCAVVKWLDDDKQQINLSLKHSAVCAAPKQAQAWLDSKSKSPIGSTVCGTVAGVWRDKVFIRLDVGFLAVAKNEKSCSRDERVNVRVLDYDDSTRQIAVALKDL